MGKSKEPKHSVTKDMTIGDVIADYPMCAEVLLANGVHCVGCHVAYHETLEQGLKGHGMDDKEVDRVISDLNEAVEQEKKDEGKEFIVTDKAAEKLKEILKENKKENAGLRISVVPGGCAGFQYGIEIDEKTTDDDKVIEEKGIKIIIPKENMKFLKGARLDFLNTLQGAGFKINNPNSTKSCGCGQSFG